MLRFLALASAVMIAAAGVMLIFSKPTPPRPQSSPPQAAERVIDPAALPSLYPVPAFKLTDARGEQISLDSLKGKIWVAMFFFTSCAGPCPVMAGHMAELAKATDSSLPVRFVSISVDPETDTPDRLKQYGARYQADFTRWHFLTGPPKEIESLANEGFKLSVNGEPVFHSEKFALVDPKGMVRGYFEGTEADSVKAVQDAIGKLLKESKE